MRLVQNGGSTDYVRGELAWHNSLKAFADKGVIPQQIAAGRAR